MHFSIIWEVFYHVQFPWCCPNVLTMQGLAQFILPRMSEREFNVWQTRSAECLRPRAHLGQDADIVIVRYTGNVTEHDAQRVDIRVDGGWLVVAHDFGCDVVVEHPFAVPLLLIGRQRRELEGHDNGTPVAEIDDICSPPTTVSLHEDIIFLQVVVEKTALMQSCEPVGDIERDVDPLQFAKLTISPRQNFAEREGGRVGFISDELEDDSHAVFEPDHAMHGRERRVAWHHVMDDRLLHRTRYQLIVDVIDDQRAPTRLPVLYLDRDGKVGRRVAHQEDSPEGTLSDDRFHVGVRGRLRPGYKGGRIEALDVGLREHGQDRLVDEAGWRKLHAAAVDYYVLLQSARKDWNQLRKNYPIWRVDVK